MIMGLLCHFLLWLASRMAPPSQRSDWLREWVAESIYLQRHHGRYSAPRFCLGAFRDSFSLWSQSGSTVSWREIVRGTSPAACLILLTIAAITAALVMWASPAIRAKVWANPVQAHAILAAGTMTIHLFFPSTSRFQIQGIRSWCFLSAKLTLLFAIVYFSSFDIIQVISRTQLQPQVAIILYWVAFRWAMNDQRRRCPVCLRLLTNPVPIGHSAGTLLSWYGTELVCSKGHGVLHEPEPLARSYCMRRWVTLDASWQQLFR